jgi:hypothetical protein
MVAVHIDERLLGHPEEPSRLPRRHPPLREPCGAGMAQRVGNDIGTKACRSTYRPEGLIDPFNRLAVPIDDGVD